MNKKHSSEMQNAQYLQNYTIMSARREPAPDKQTQLQTNAFWHFTLKKQS